MDTLEMLEIWLLQPMGVLHRPLEIKPVSSGGLKSHAAAVWCVSDLANGYIVTGAADKIVNVYLRNGVIVHKLKGHTDCVRDIAVINENEFLTCANDAIIKRWIAATGDCLGDFYGHSNYIYSMSALYGGNLVVSSGEDKTIRVWLKGEIDQTITLPAQSVWCVKLLPNEDIACGSSDGILRIFTTDSKRYADSETIQKFEESVAYTEQTQDFGDLKTNDLPDSSSLHQPGKKDGEIKLVKEDTNVKAYSWSQKELKWNLVGDVMGGNSSNSGKQLFNGIEYDYIFSVDIQDGIPPLKLPYNNGQDPWLVAQKFIDDNSLSQLYLEQVANFIIKNSKVAPVVNSKQYDDPYTGTSRHIPNSLAQTVHQPVDSSMVKPLSASLNPSTYIPLTTFLKLEQANVTAIHEKLKEFNLKQQSEGQSVLEDKLESVIKLALNENQEIIEAETINTLMTLLRWPDSFVFPILDIARLAVLQATVTDKLCTDEFFHLLERHLSKDAIAANQMLTFRLFANMFVHDVGERLCLRYKNELLKFIPDLTSPANKNTQIAVSTYILNLVVSLTKRNDVTGKTQVLNTICNCFTFFKEAEAIFRIFVGLGTLLKKSVADERAQLVNILLESEYVLSTLKRVSDGLEPNLQNKLVCVSKDIINLIF
ncbi:PREDICTED: phospholipase A-2-activating protein isoform X2 [Ceratosolen solmsi marchali]|uniref:Phospholipase A-2-activating protein isoform X2 n=1 Tax=Ceratosolen solmsi marchali TaxID=326594 RepID=A0AAJ6YJH4_9HYME|nr:PREDICTED: phospholipase A-2-activating protein isoform X2 [Ceratosolen solmsi marchali]